LARGRRSNSFDAAVLMKKIKYRVKPLLVLLSLFIVIGVFWQLKLVGITLAGDAFCGMEEHQHSDSCYGEEAPCELEEHIHIVSCYSDITADLENSADWEATFADVKADETPADTLVAIAVSQLGYTESERNFIVDEEGNRHGYTRYGEWYGNPYGEWATMFTSFCLHYSEFDEKLTNSGADAMRLAWDEKGRYQTAEGYTPVQGDIVFLNTNEKEAVDTTAIICEVEEDSIIVIEGDVDNQVTKHRYDRNDESIIGYGVVQIENEEVSNEVDEEVTTETVDESSNKEETRVVMKASARAGEQVIANTVAYHGGLFNTENTFLLYTIGADGKYYALDGNANAVEIQIDSNGRILSGISDPSLLYWTFEYCGNYDYQNSYYIRNNSTGLYLHPFYNDAYSHNIILTGRWESALYSSGSGVKIRGARQNAYVSLSGTRFTDVNNLNAASTIYFGRIPDTCTVWLDGTNGNLMSLRDSANQSYTVVQGNTFTLPEEWQSPGKYEYELKGWYEVISAKYYPPGAEIVVTDNMVFYAYWEAASYDIGEYNSHVADTVSTNEFITTRMFDYNFLFNVQSAYARTTVDGSGHSEEWQLMQSGTVPYNSQNTLNYIFRDWDANRDISYPLNTNDQNTYNGNIHVYSGLYTPELGNILFGTDNSFNPATGEGIIGKKYLGTGDHLFQFMTDPSDELYGYYYYDSARNAASYNQTDQRFYVYDYLERTSESANISGEAVEKYSDFLPLNSPYANTNDKDIVTYEYEGEHGEYEGVPHIMYDSKYNDSGSAPEHVTTNFGFGMSIDVDFYLPEKPGSTDEEGNLGNQDIYGKDMHFHFSGDDDVWVLLDGQLILDIGGIHGVENGDINFATGVVSVNGVQTGLLDWVEPGEHVLTIYYLERGSSQSNCAMYFNLAPRFSLSIQKEDVLTQDVLNGAQFSVYTDRECTEPAELWVSEEAHNNGEKATHVFTVEDGIANMWGFGAGLTYYIKETRPPDAAEYSHPNGIIKLSIDKKGIATYSVEILEEDGEISAGFTVHGFKINEETQEAYIVATNAPKWVEETTDIMAMKKWDDTQDHTYDEVTVYLTVTDADGTVRRIREIVLNEENGWKYVWTNLPKYEKDGTTLVQYDVEEGYFPGYYSSTEQKEKIVVEKTTLNDSSTIEKGKAYLLRSPQGYLSTTAANATTFQWIDEKTAVSSPLALWSVSDLNGNYRFRNGAGQTITYQPNYQNGYFWASTGNTVSDHQRMILDKDGNGYKFYRTHYGNNYFGSLKSDGTAYFTTNRNSGITFTPVTFMTITEEHTVDGYAFEVTNTPLDEETSLKVMKEWEVGAGTSELYEKAQVTVKLLANGKDTGRTVTLSLKNKWSDTFQGLPYRDADGNVITYTVEESWNTKDWLAKYGEVITVDGDPPTYETTVMNIYRWGRGYELPATGRRGPGVWILSGLVMAIGSLVYGCIWRRKRERRYEK